METSERLPVAPDGLVYLVLEPHRGQASGEYLVQIKGGIKLHTSEPRPFTPALAERICLREPQARVATADDFELHGIVFAPVDQEASPAAAACAACHQVPEDQAAMRAGFCAECAEFHAPLTAAEALTANLGLTNDEKVVAFVAVEFDPAIGDNPGEQISGAGSVPADAPELPPIDTSKRRKK